MSEGEKCEACGDPLGEHHPTEVALGLCYHGYSVHERETGHSIEECLGPRGHLFRDAELEGEHADTSARTQCMLIIQQLRDELVPVVLPQLQEIASYEEQMWLVRHRSDRPNIRERWEG